LGGSQFVDSPATGRYHSYLCDEIVPWVDAHYRTLARKEARGIAGKSSGGYGAMITPMLRPDLWGGFSLSSRPPSTPAYAGPGAPIIRRKNDIGLAAEIGRGDPRIVVGVAVKHGKECRT
jgi:putative esterase